jgi:hypothetical protein
VHLITLRDAFVGYVLPSKVHACIASGKRILYVGSASSDVDLLASDAVPSNRYRRVDVGDVDGLVNALRGMERAVVNDRKSADFPRDGAKALNPIPGSLQLQKDQAIQEQTASAIETWR